MIYSPYYLSRLELSEVIILVYFTILRNAGANARNTDEPIINNFLPFIPFSCSCGWESDQHDPSTGIPVKTRSIPNVRSHGSSGVRMVSSG